MVLMGLYLISFGVVTHLDFVYLLPGHSFMPCDQGFSTLENKFKKYESITTPQKYADIIQQVINSRHVDLIQKDIYDFKQMSQIIVHRTSKNPEIKFSKAHTISLRDTHPWYMFLHATAGIEEVCLSIDPTEKRPFKELYHQSSKSKGIKHKYFVGQDIKLSQTKLQHLRHLRSFMDAQGRSWADRVFRGQETANERPRTQVNSADPDLTNLIDEYEIPQRVHQADTQNLDDSGNEINDHYPERPQPSPQSSPQPSPEPSPVAVTPPSPNGDTEITMSFINELFQADLAEIEDKERLPSVEEDPPEPRRPEPNPQPSTSRGEPGLNIHHLRFLIEKNDEDSDSD